MSMVVEATYENGMLKLEQPLPLAEHEKVQITVHTAVSRVARLSACWGGKGMQERSSVWRWIQNSASRSAHDVHGDVE